MKYVELRRHSKRDKPLLNLSDEGINLAVIASKHLKKPDICISSGIQRADETARALGFEIDFIKEDFALFPTEIMSEINWYDGLEKFSDLYKSSKKFRTYANLLKKSIIDELKRVQDGERILIISHGGIIESAIVGCLPNYDFSYFGSYFDYCEGGELVFDGEKFVNFIPKRIASDNEDICMNPIGYIRTSFNDTKNMPIQPIGNKIGKSRIEIKPTYQKGLKDLIGFSHMILIYYFHKSSESKLQVKPFLDNTIRGIFSVRAPSRPNKIGISVVGIVDIFDNIIIFRNADILDKTPLLDIKPFVPQFDNPDNVRIGWLEGKSKKAENARSDNRFSE